MQFKLEICGSIDELADVVGRIQDIKDLNEKSPLEMAFEPLIESLDSVAYAQQELADIWGGVETTEPAKTEIAEECGPGELCAAGELVE